MNMKKGMSFYERRHLLLQNLNYTAQYGETTALRLKATQLACELFDPKFTIEESKKDEEQENNLQCASLQVPHGTGR